MNASQRALVQPINVELAVLRITEDRTLLPRDPFTGSLPDLPERVESETERNIAVARCEYSAGLLEGSLLSSKPAGEWTVNVDVDGERELLGSVEVASSGAFRMVLQRWSGTFIARAAVSSPSHAGSKGPRIHQLHRRAFSEPPARRNRRAFVAHRRGVGRGPGLDRHP